MTISLSQPRGVRAYAVSRELGGFILIDRLTRNTVGAGMVDRPARRRSDIHWHQLDVRQGRRAPAMKGQKPAVLWFTGLSGAGKSTIANLVEKRLHAAGAAHHDAWTATTCATG